MEILSTTKKRHTQSLFSKLIPFPQTACDQKKDCDDTSCDSSYACQVCTDNDSDGYYAESGCGTAADCNDNSSAINPGADEICGDGLDNDCVNGDKECPAPTYTLAEIFVKMKSNILSRKFSQGCLICLSVKTVNGVWVKVNLEYFEIQKDKIPQKFCDSCLISGHSSSDFLL